MGPRHTDRLRVGDTRLDLVVGQRGLPVSNRSVKAWVERSARLVAEYCGGFPVERLAVRVVVGVPGEVLFGQHWRGRRVSVLVGAATTPEALETDWILIHELAHTALPDLADRHLWMREGLSTYLQTLLRARGGILDERELWTRWTENLPRGQPRRSHRGLDRDGGRDRTYWGGALFWFLADVEIRRRTDGRRSLRDAVRAIREYGGTSRTRWSMARLLEVADYGSGTRVVSELYGRLGRSRGDVDLDALFARLGVHREGDDLRLDDDAELAPIRRAMSAPRVELPPIPR